jgi:deoxyribonuclease (pyrimidine dimer)
MTRINLIDPSLLLDQHLMAECREIAHIYSQVERFYKPEKLKKIPKSFTLNTGHVTFFIDKLSFIVARHIRLAKELQRRGVNKEFDLLAVMQRYDSMPDELKNDFCPSAADIDISVARLVQRFQEKPLFYKYNKLSLYKRQEDVEPATTFFIKWQSFFKGETQC